MRVQIFIALALLAAVGCTQSNNSTTGTASGPPAMNSPDNTAVNERDRQASEKTPIDQDENTADITVTSKIRQRIVAEKNFSIDAQNIKVITSKAHVTLKGPVQTLAEKDRIVAIAGDVAGADHVTDQIDVVGGSTPSPAEPPAASAPANP